MHASIGLFTLVFCSIVGSIGRFARERVSFVAKTREPGQYHRGRYYAQQKLNGLLNGCLVTTNTWLLEKFRPVNGGRNATEATV